jgi:cobalt/nickel transport system permease protein
MAVGIGFIITAINLSKWYLLAGMIAVMLVFLTKEPRIRVVRKLQFSEQQPLKKSCFAAGRRETARTVREQTGFSNKSIVLRRIIPVNIFNLFLALSLFLGDYGPPAMLALRYFLRINAAVLVYMLFIVPLGISGIANVLLKTGVPKKLTALLILTYRSIFVIHERLSVSLLSMSLREPKKSTLSRWRSYAAVFAAFLASALFRSLKIEIAMRERGFKGAFPVTAVFVWKTQDTVWLAVLLSFGAMLLVIERILM